MKSIIFTGVTLMTPLMTLCADGEAAQEGSKACYANYQPSAPIKPVHEHRVNFGFLNLGYERIKPDSVYTGFETKVSSLWHTKDANNVTLDHFVNGELRLGYNHSMSKTDSITGYGGVGFSLFSIEKEVGKLKNWSYGTLGIKYMHQFGDMFEMGLHLKGYLSISQRRYKEGKVLQPKARLLYKLPDDKSITDTLGDLPTIEFANANEIYEEPKPVSVHDTRWLCEIGLPMAWHIGDLKNWEIQFEPYYLQIPNVQRTHVLGSRLSFGYRY